MSSIRLEEVVKKFTDKEVSLFKKKGREIKAIFAFDIEKVKLFDPESELAIVN